MSDPKSPEAVEQRPSPYKPASYRVPFTIVSISIVILIGYIATLYVGRDVIEKTAGSANRIADGVGAIAGRFRSENITQTFISQLPEITSTGNGNLELVTLNATEIFRRENVKTIAWDFISLGTTVTEIRVPVTYRYHLKFSDPWELDIEGNNCIVRAPAIAASQPPAIHTDRMEKRFGQGWLRFDAAQELDALEKSITPLLGVYAYDARRVSMVREEGRKVVANFVRDWLLKEDHWRTDRFASITVLFPDETPELFDGPTLELDSRIDAQNVPVL